jgi:hypothetical protein
MLNHRNTDAQMRVAALPDGTVLLVGTRRLGFCGFRLVAPHVRAGMENLSASHQKNGQRANGPNMPA